MKILFDIGLPSHLRHFDNVVDELRARGHDVVVTACMDNERLYTRRAISQDHRTVLSDIVFIVNEPWGELSYLLRCTRDVLHYRRQEFGRSTLLRRRVEHMMQYGLSEACSQPAQTLMQVIDRATPDTYADMSATLGSIEAALPASEKLKAFVRKHRPDVLLITPLIVTQYNQAELVKAARWFQVPVGYMVFSWDNISTKGVLHTEPDAIFVWNKIQEAELQTFYGITNHVYKCGAPRFDYFFAKTPSCSREDFCRAHSLDPRERIITYLCSSNLVSRSEVDFVSKWMETLDTSPDDRVKRCNIIIRPHPKFLSLWENRDCSSATRRVAVAGSKRLNNDDLLFDSLYHSAAIVGLNTSAQLEAAILGKPVLTIRVPEYSEGQEGTIHFHYLLKTNGGCVEEAHDLTEHLRQLTDALHDNYDRGQIADFVSMFIRPQGMDRPAATVMAESIEAFGHGARTPDWSRRAERGASDIHRGISTAYQRVKKAFGKAFPH